jgi:hypothetical protein
MPVTLLMVDPKLEVLVVVCAFLVAQNRRVVARKVCGGAVTNSGIYEARNSEYDYVKRGAL